ncbi:pyruvate dehydrogenase [acetyl-transferring]-phosphatase 1, mitochondrial-like [Acanthaster planci]|uniref:Pyruvate dehydrogenase [acetyl-transferring]-phosphatase 1, mitochondrial-like n=1 Tax=Acanthaster planci TaxID=133434 RepID=A0A8B7ZLZ1_ACAPL|nr:pyruvate dehydrogenase [acetyl-transferring]-phosphatase 1, mitochondrial-like [Acanthaster planci]
MARLTRAARLANVTVGIRCMENITRSLCCHVTYSDKLSAIQGQCWNKCLNPVNRLKTLCSWKPLTFLGRVVNQPVHWFHTTGVQNWYGHLTITPEQVNSILHRNELAVEVDASKCTSVKTFMTNQLRSNNPVEDRRAEAACVMTKAMLFGVFDGHHGPACAQVVSERLFNYIAAEALPYKVLQEALRMFASGELLELVEWYQHPNDYISRDRQTLFRHSLGQYMKDNLEMDFQGEDRVADVLMTSFDRLDKDLSTEAQSTSNGEFNDEGLHTVFSGACACVAYVEADDLYVANAGDCRAVLGRQSDNEPWSAIALSNDHNAQNIDEVRRLRSAHPQDESSTVIKNGRLLSELAPLRAFGDVRYKWSQSLQHQVLNPWFGTNVIPKNFHTPPYLIATPEVIHHRLTPDDRFLILATDGLWDFLTPEKAVSLVGEFLLMSDKVGNFRPPSTDMTLEHIHQMLSRRKAALWPRDDNVATHLIRYALGGVHNRFDHHRLANTLSLPDNVVRQYRDDITVTVVFFQ